MVVTNILRPIWLWRGGGPAGGWSAWVAILKLSGSDVARTRRLEISLSEVFAVKSSEKFGKMTAVCQEAGCGLKSHLSRRRMLHHLGKYKFRDSDLLSCCYFQDIGNFLSKKFTFVSFVHQFQVGIFDPSVAYIIPVPVSSKSRYSCYYRYWSDYQKTYRYIRTFSSGMRHESYWVPVSNKVLSNKLFFKYTGRLNFGYHQLL